MYPLLRVEAMKLGWRVLLPYAFGLALFPLLDDVALLIPYFIAGFLFMVFSGDLWGTYQFLISKPYKRSRLFFGIFHSHLLLVFILIVPLALLNPISTFFVLFALPFLPLGYLMALMLENPRKTMAVGVLVFLILTFVPPGIIQMKAQDKAQSDLGIQSLEDYEVKKIRISRARGGT